MSGQLVALILKFVVFAMLAASAYADYRTKEALRQQIEIQKQIIHTLQSNQEGTR